MASRSELRKRRHGSRDSLGLHSRLVARCVGQAAWFQGIDYVDADRHGKQVIQLLEQT